MKKLSKETLKAIESAVSVLAGLEDILQEAIDTAEEYAGERSDKWQEKQGGNYEEFVANIQNLRDATENLKDELEQAGEILYTPES